MVSKLLSKTVVLPIVDNKIAVNFPNKCIYCAGFAETTMQQKVNTRVEYRNQTVTYTLNFGIPYCRYHANLSESNDKFLSKLFIYSWIPATVVNLILAPRFFGMSFSEFLKYTYIEGAVGFLMWGFVNFIPALGIAILIYSLPKLLPFIFKNNETLRHQPSFFTQGGGLGVSMNFQTDRKAMIFKFANSAIAEEFAKINNVKIGF